MTTFSYFLWGLLWFLQDHRRACYCIELLPHIASQCQAGDSKGTSLWCDISVAPAILHEADSGRLREQMLCKDSEKPDACFLGPTLWPFSLWGSHNFWVASVWGSLNYHGIPLRTPLRLPLIHSYQTCFSSLLICSSSHVSQVTAALLSDGPTASPMKPDSYKGWISCKRIFIRKKNPFIFCSFMWS